MAVMLVSELTIYNSLYSVIKNPFGVCGLMGNLKAESNLLSTNLQNTFNRKLGLSDEEYTRKVDDGSYTNFVHDSAGYGLAQWTFYTRKQNLLNFAKSKNKSIGDETMQIEFLISEIKGYTNVWNALVNAKTVKEASDAVLTGYERPKNQDNSVKDKRASFGEEFYTKLVASKTSKEVKTMSNSSLVNCTVKSPNHSGKRTHSIDRITPHCVVGQLTAESIGGCFTSKSRQASCNYGIGKDGRVVLVVDEENRSWCSSSSSNDQRSVTIECASDTNAPYAFNSAVYNKLVDLCVDICRRNGKKKLIWISDKTKALVYSPKSDEMQLTVHRWFANKSCPGDWMFNKMGELANTVTAKLGGATTNTETNTAQTNKSTNYIVRVDISNLNIRKGPGTNYATNGVTGKGSFTIVDESSGQGSKAGWGKLKSGAGWISLDYATKVR